MKNSQLGGFVAVMILMLAGVSVGTAQRPAMLKRTITKTDRFDFGAGGTVTITGAPTGSIRVVGSPKNEIEITAEIELQAGTEADLAKLAEVTGFVTEESPGRTGIVTIGTHNKIGLKSLPKKFPKNLLGLPFTINYVINVPRYCDLEIDGGKGDLSISGVEGTMQINFLETKAKIEVISGPVVATIAAGSVEVAIGTHGWRPRTANIKVASGDLTVRLPANMSAEIDATILKTGKIENMLADLKPRDRKMPFTDKSILAKANVGGAALNFTVGDGTLTLKNLVLPF